MPRLEAPARHAGVEHGHGAVDAMGRVGVWGPPKGEKARSHQSYFGYESNAEKSTLQSPTKFGRI